MVGVKIEKKIYSTCTTKKHEDNERYRKETGKSQIDWCLSKWEKKRQTAFETHEKRSHKWQLVWWR